MRNENGEYNLTHLPSIRALVASCYYSNDLLLNRACTLSSTAGQTTPHCATDSYYIESWMPAVAMILPRDQKLLG
jgi:hypothetical protein